MNKKTFPNPVKLQEVIDKCCIDGIIEYDYGDHYDDNGPIPNAPKEKRYRLSFFVPGNTIANSTLSVEPFFVTTFSSYWPAVKNSFIMLLYRNYNINYNLLKCFLLLKL